MGVEDIRHSLAVSSSGNMAAVNLTVQSLSSIPPEGHFVNCSLCGKIFKGSYCKYNLQKHMTIHQGLRPFVCPLCHMGFNQKASMQRHLLGVHNRNYKKEDDRAEILTIIKK